MTVAMAQYTGMLMLIYEQGLYLVKVHYWKKNEKKKVFRTFTMKAKTHNKVIILRKLQLYDFH